VILISTTRKAARGHSSPVVCRPIMVKNLLQPAEAQVPGSLILGCLGACRLALRYLTIRLLATRRLVLGHLTAGLFALYHRLAFGHLAARLLSTRCLALSRLTAGLPATRRLALGRLTARLFATRRLSLG